MEDKEASSLDDHSMTASSDNMQDAFTNMAHATKSGGRMLVGNMLKSWAEVSKLNYLENLSWRSRRSSIRLRSFAIACKELHTMPSLLPNGILKKTEEIITEEFPKNVTSLMNEEQLWGCFYNFPELYNDMYSPVVRVLELRDVADLVEGVLTRDMVAACLTYLRRTPILADYVYIKLDLQGKRLININVLQHYKYLVYLDLSSNLLKDIKVLSHLLYLQYLSVDFNRLETVLDYSTPQWYLTEVHYKYNSVKSIRDLDMFWSITILDLSRNNIKCISGLESLKYLRHLDLSFNHIQRLENLNHLRLLWLDVSYNNISSFELGPEEGLWTLLHLEYLNLNENNLKSMKMFSGCTRLNQLHLRNNGMSSLLELAVYMRQLRRLTVLDLRANPICSAPGYADVIFDTFSQLLNLDAKEIDPVRQRSSKMDMLPDVNTFASRRLLRLLYVEQLSRARVLATPPADTQEVPLVVLVGQEAVGKEFEPLISTISTFLDFKYGVSAIVVVPGRYYLARPQYLRQIDETIAEHYILVSQQKFDDMILAGEFLSYSEIDGDSYGLSREEAFISDGKVSVCAMDLIGALMLRMRGRRPYLILTYCHDQMALAARQLERKSIRVRDYEKLMSTEPHQQQSTLAVLLSGRIVINGILNEIILVPSNSQQFQKLMSTEPHQQQSTLAVLLSGRIVINGILNEIILVPSNSQQFQKLMSTEPHQQQSTLAVLLSGRIVINDILNEIVLVPSNSQQFQKLMSTEPHQQQSTLAVLLSGRIVINGILNEIILVPSNSQQFQKLMSTEPHQQQSTLAVLLSGRIVINDILNEIVLVPSNSQQFQKLMSTEPHQQQSTLTVLLSGLIVINGILNEIVLVPSNSQQFQKLMSTEPHQQQSTLAVLLSGRIVINGILNEIILVPSNSQQFQKLMSMQKKILLCLPDDKGRSEFALGSECSLFNSAHRTAKQAKGADVLSLLGVSSDESIKSRRPGEDSSLQSLYKRSQDSSVAVTASLGSSDDRKNKHHTCHKKTDGTDMARGSALRFNEESDDRRRSSMWKGFMSTKSSKSVTFTTPGVGGATNEPPADFNKQGSKVAGRSISSKLPLHERAYTSPDDMDLWLAFLTDTGVLTVSDTARDAPTFRPDNIKSDDPESIIRQLTYYNKTHAATLTSNVRDDYEDIHRLCPGMFRDTIAMDDPKKAFQKAKQIIRDIVNSQTGLRPMFDIDFTNNLYYYPTVEQRLEDIRQEIAPRQIFC